MATLAANSEQSSRWNMTKTMGGLGDCERRAAISQAFRETLREVRTVSAPAVGFAVRVAEPFRSGRRVRARITARQAPFRKERGTPCACASLRSGALTGRAHARKSPPAMFGMSLFALAGQTFQGGNASPANN